MGEHHEVSIFTWLLERMGFHPPDYLVMATVIAGALMVFAFLASRTFRLERPSRFQVALEEIVRSLKSLVDEVIGGDGTPYLPVIGMFLFFILLANYAGLVPGLQPPTMSMNVTLALAIISFVYYNWKGIQKQGLIPYVRHFGGPMLALAVLIFPVEIISHFVRILSLSMRLFGNIFGEHTAGGVFHGLVPFPFLYPIFLMALGFIAATLQAFIFTILSVVYIAGAVAEEH